MDPIRLETKELQSELYLTQTQTDRPQTHWTRKSSQLGQTSQLQDSCPVHFTNVDNFYIPANCHAFCVILTQNNTMSRCHA